MNEYRVKPCVCCSEWSVRSRLRTSIVRFDGVKLYEYITYIFVACPGVRMQAVQSAITFPPVSLSVTLRYCVKVAKHIVKRNSFTSDRPIILIFHNNNNQTQLCLSCDICCVITFDTKKYKHYSRLFDVTTQTRLLLLSRKQCKTDTIIWTNNKTSDWFIEYRHFW